MNDTHLTVIRYGVGTIKKMIFSKRAWCLERDERRVDRYMDDRYTKKEQSRGLQVDNYTCGFSWIRIIKNEWKQWFVLEKQQGLKN